MSVHWNPLEGVFRQRLLGTKPEFLIEKAWGRAWELALLTSSQVMLVSLVWEPYFSGSREKRNI